MTASKAGQTEAACSGQKRVISKNIELPNLSVWDSARRIARSGQRGMANQFLDLIKLRFSRSQLGASEYYYYRLFEDGVSSAERERYVGWRRETAIKPLITTAGWQVTVQDKVLFNTICRGLGLPVAKQIAFYHQSQSLPGIRSIHTAEELEDFLLAQAQYPIFGKPWRSDRSRGVADLRYVDTDRKHLTLGSGETLSVSEFARQVEDFQEMGYLFEERLEPDVELQRMVGNTLSTLRVIVLMREGVPEIYRTLWKIPVGDSMADNFWRSNLLADLDRETGRVRRIIRGIGPDLTEVEAHPDTGYVLLGTCFPRWRDLLDLCLVAAPAFWGIKMQAYDVTLTKRGPVIVEMNVCGDVNLPQLAAGKGLLDEQFEAFLREETLPERQRDSRIK